MKFRLLGALFGLAAFRIHSWRRRNESGRGYVPPVRAAERRFVQHGRQYLGVDRDLSWGF